MGVERKIILLISRVLSFFFGGAMLLFGGASMLVPRANFVSSTPPAGSIITESPAAVIVNFSSKLSPESQIDVVSTMRLSPSGSLGYLTGARSVISSGSNRAIPAADRFAANDYRTSVFSTSEWRTKSEGWRSITYASTLRFGMPVPEHIRRYGELSLIGTTTTDVRRAHFWRGFIISLAFALPAIERSRTVPNGQHE